MTALRLLLSLPASLRFLRLAVPSFILRFCSLHGREQALESLELLTRTPHRILKMDLTVYPRFLGNLLYICSALRPRSDKGTRSVRSPCTALASIKAKAPTRQFSRLNHTAFALAVYASHWKLLPHMQDSLPAVDQTLPGRSLPPC